MYFNIICISNKITLKEVMLLRSKDVLQLLRVTRQTLSKYVRDGKIHVRKLPNGHYDYDSDDVYAIFNKNVERKTCLYARVSTAKQKPDLENQISMLKQFLFRYCQRDQL